LDGSKHISRLVLIIKSQQQQRKSNKRDIKRYKQVESLGKILFWEKPIKKCSRRIAKTLPFLSNTSVTHNLAKKLGTSDEGAHMAMIGFITFLSPGLFKVIWTPLAIVELIRAYKKDRFKGIAEVGKWYLRSSAVAIIAKEGPAIAFKIMREVIKA